jgi:hypothetical protein
MKLVWPVHQTLPGSGKGRRARLDHTHAIANFVHQVLRIGREVGPGNGYSSHPPLLAALKECSRSCYA